MNVSRFDASNPSANLTISYDAAAGTYTIRDGSVSAAFASSDRSSNGFLDVYTKQSGTISDELRLFNNVRSGASQSGAPLQLTYLSYGTWIRTDTSTGETRATHLLFGYPTATADMPRTGSATYQTTVNATTIDIRISSTETPVAGTATFTADFGTGAINTGLTLQSIGTFTGTGTISSNQFAGTFSSSDPYFKSGNFTGGFFGPNAAEMGYTFAIKTGAEDPYAGASVAPFLSYTTGTVIGKKQ